MDAYNEPLKLHYRPLKGWNNDPNGLVYFQGWYHVFYQYAPHFERPWKEPMHWGHARTKDFLHWEELEPALIPDQPYDDKGCWSGTAIVKDDVLYLFYASLYIPEGKDRPVQTVSMAYSKDGLSFEKYPKNPIIGSFPEDGSPDFRDPAVACIDGQYYLVMASGHRETHSARLLLYQSSDLFSWRYKGILMQWEDADFAECPSFVHAGDKMLLTVSVVSGKKRWFSVNYGSFRNGMFFPEISAQPDKGPDQYAGQVFTDHKGRNLLITWIPGWPYSEWADHNVGCLSVPRELKAADGKITAFPVDELQPFLKDDDPAITRTADGFIIPRTRRDPAIYHGNIRDLKLLRDEYVLEVFVNGGEETFSVLL